MKVAVVGAGWAGLAAGVGLAARGIEAHLFEASPQLGGRARRVTAGGVDLDNGQHILIGAYRATLDAMRAAGAPAEQLLRRIPLELRYAHGVRLRAPRLPWPLNLAAALALARGLPPGALRRAARLLAAAKPPGPQPDRSVAAWLGEQGQAGTLRTHLWEPLCAAALNTPPASASARVFASVLHRAFSGPRDNSDLLVPAADLGRLFPEPAAVFIRARGGSVSTRAAVRRIARRGEAFHLDGRPAAYERVIVATAPQHASDLLREFPALESLRAWFSTLAYEAITTCYLQYEPQVRLPAPMLGFAGGIVQWAFDRGLLGGPAGLVAAVTSTATSLAGLSHAAIATRVQAEVATALGAAARPRWTRVISERRATFSCRPGLERPSTVTPVPGLLLAGDYLEPELPATLESAARAGARAAQCALDI
ncbi:MAG: FAD-dependent oxidoreductase [Burkholderiales bacterium]|nr:FAD-dependent oxidoreductase [Burkholderiales bacterium]